jgi:Transglutaminase-like superfamily
MSSLFFKSWLTLLYLEFLMRFRRFNVLHRVVREHLPRSIAEINRVPLGSICHAIDLACALYFKQVLCLQRSTATTLILRRHGWRAEMVVGVQILPFRSHAWVEVDNKIVNDKPYMLDIYQVLERC